MNRSDEFSWEQAIETENMNCYEYYVKSTVQYGEYDALQHMDQRIKRSEFIRDIEALAAYFYYEKGIRKGDVYTVFCPTNVESLVAFYALNKIGAIANFVHPLLPTDKIIGYLKMTKSKGVMLVGLLAKDHTAELNKLGIPVLVCHVSDYASPIKMLAAGTGEDILQKVVFKKYKNAQLYKDVMKRYRGKHVHDAPTAVGTDIAVYLNGGGTTGKSKTIKLTCKNINEVVYKCGYIDAIQVPGEEAEIIVLPFFHAFGLCLAGHMALCNAGRLIPLMQFNAKLVVNLYKKNNVIAMVGIPNMFKKLYHTEGFDSKYLKNTRMMFVGGDDLSLSFLKDFNDMLEKNGTSARLRQGYGLTEVCAPCCANTNWDNKDGSIGLPFHGIRMEIWDDDCHEVPNGTVGEICVAGSTVMDGYLTEDGEEHAGLYFDEEGTAWVRSGDLGYKDDDGYFWFAGRKKRLIIISGYNVYPVDIENTIDALDYVRESCAVQGKYENGKPYVKLYVSLLNDNGDYEAYKQEICSLIEKKLSEFSVPREIIFMEDLPHTPLEKVDFMKLTAMKEDDPEYKPVMVIK